MQDLKISFTVPRSPQQVFDAITNVRGWWSPSLEGKSARQGDEFKYRHGDLHVSRHLLTEVVPGQKITWLTTDSSINFVGNKQEWDGTFITFEIKPENGQTELEFIHHGLTPALECFEACSGAWNYYLDSLRELIVTGAGHPDKGPNR